GAAARKAALALAVRAALALATRREVLALAAKAAAAKIHSLRLSLVVGSRRRDKDLVAPDDGGRPAKAGERDLPLHVAVISPFRGQLVVRLRRASRPAKLRPFAAPGHRHAEKESGDNSVTHLSFLVLKRSCSRP